MRGVWRLPLLAAVVAFPALWLVRSYPWQLALLTATAIAAFVYAIQRTVQNMRGLVGSNPVPWESRQRETEQQMDPPAQHHSHQEQEHPRREQETAEIEASFRQHVTTSESQRRG